MFRKITLENFKSYSDMEFEFAQNKFAVITGNNGTGKSTIFDALCWCLYDKTITGRSGDSVLNIRNPRDCYVKLELTIDGVPCTVENYRNHSVHENGKYVTYDGDTNIYTGGLVKDTNKNIETIVMPYSVFVNSLIYSNSMDPTKSFYTMKDSDQKSILDLILGIDKFGDYYKTFSEKLSEIDKTILISEKDLESSESKLEAHRNALYEAVQIQSKVIYDMEERVSDLEKEVEQKTSDLEKVKKEADGLRDVVSSEELRLGVIESELLELNNKKYRYDSELDKMHEMKDRELSDLTNRLNYEKMENESILEKSVYIKKINEITGEIGKLQIDYTHAMDTKKQEYRNRRREIETEYSRMEENHRHETGSVKREISGLIEERESVSTRYAKYSDEIDNLKNQLDSDIPVCYACGQEAKGEEAKAKLRNKLNELETTTATQRERLRVIDSDMGNLEEKLNDMDYRLKEITDRTNLKYSELAEWKSETKKKLEDEHEINITSKQSELAEFKSKYDTEKKQIEFYHAHSLEIGRIEIENKWKDRNTDTTNSLDRIVRELSEKMKEKEDTNRKIGRLKDRIGSISLAEIELSHAISNLDRLRNDIKIQDERLEAINNTFAEKIREAASVRHVSEITLNRSINERKMCEFWKRAYSKDGIKAIILDDSIPILNGKSRELSTLTRNLKVSYSAQKQLKSGDNRNQFSIIVKQTDNLTEDKRDLSSGESKIVNISVFLSLRHLLEHMHNVKFNIFLLDEVLDALDPDNVGVATDMMRALSNDYCVVLITHTLRDNIDADELFNLS